MGDDETGGAVRLEELETAEVPAVHETAWIAPSADVRGDVTVGEHASIWYGCVLRGDIDAIRIGARSNVQDLTTVHVDRGYPAEVGERVGIGHRAVIHGCEIEDDCLIGMGAIVLSGARIGSGSVIGAGALVREGAEIPPGSLVVGVPGTVIRAVDDELRDRIRSTWEHYRELKEGHRSGRWRSPGGDRSSGAGGPAGSRPE